MAELFVAVAECLVVDAGAPTGIGPERADTYQIDLATFTAYTDALLRQSERSRHPIRRSLVDGLIATAIVLVERAGGRPPILEASRDADRWRELRDQHALPMPA